MKLPLLLISLPLIIGVAGAVSIVRLEVPEVVKANSSAVMLDCDYQVDEWERPGLVVKWYVDKIHLVYQWIPPRRPQALGVLAGRVDTAHRASRDPWAAHRAIYIPRPHPALSGQYSCTVSTFEDEDTRTASLLVWTPPRHTVIRLWRPSEHLVNVTCTASGAAPRPEFYLYTRDANGTRQEVDVRGVEGRREDGVWWAGAWGLLAWEETEPGTIVGCTVTLPGTRHTETRNKIYHADLPIITTTTTTTTTTAPTTTTTNGLLHPRSNLSKDGVGATTATSFFDFPSLFGSASTSGGVQPVLGCGHSGLILLVAQMWRVWDVTL